METRKGKTEIELVIDTNIIISALIPKYSELRKIILSGNIHIYAPEYLLKELDKFWNTILAKAKKKGVSASEVDFVKEELLSKIIFEPEKFYLPAILQAYSICKEFDEKDTPFIALSLMLKIPILTNDKSIIENAGTYKVITLEELFRLVKL